MALRDLVRVSKVNSIPNFPVRACTLYQWVHLKKNPEIFVHLGRNVYVDLEALEKLMEKGRLK